MITADVPNERGFETLKLLTDELRWSLAQQLRWSDRQVGELVQALHQPQNLVSYHLSVLRQAGLVHMRRSEADARVVYYGLDLSAMRELYAAFGTSFGLAAAVEQPTTISAPVLFLCTENSARSQMAEGWLRALSGGRVPARSAGTVPKTLHPLATQVMAEAGIDIGYQQAKRVSMFADVQPAAVITVCDRAREERSAQVSAPITYHWSVPDPARAAATDQLQAFRDVRDQLRARVEGLLHDGLAPAQPAR
ncbi:MAG: ArsR family transcriptional regulator [Roseiflexaceae bacterium]|nr:ArsR family transcriptional regulator [Roseiflexaceae bacterium]